MGVQGLTSFIDENPVLLKDHRLHDTQVVIDGNNLCYFLYYNYYNINMRYGGDYDIYADSLRCYFNTLKACNIDPYVIFDGAYEQNNRKLKTNVNRSDQRLMQATRVANGQRGHILPLLCFETFQSVLGEMKINHMRCDFEADDQLAVLANEWACPVMSNDSDFFIFNLKGGFIIYDYLNLEIKQDKKDGVPYKFLNVQIYYLDTLLSFYKGLDHERIALFAALTGNDYVDRGQFSSFFAKAKFPDPSAHRLTTSRRHRNLVSLLMWLESTQDLESAVSAISSFIPKGKQNSIRDLLHKSVKSYTCIDSNLKEYFGGGDCKTIDVNSWKSYANKEFPDWLVGCLRRSELPLFLLNVLVTRRLIFLCQVEIIKNQSSFKCASDLQKVLFSILATLDDPPSEDDNKTDRRIYLVDVYDREKKAMKWKKVGTIDQLPDGSAVPDIARIPELKRSEREQILLSSLEVSADALKEVPSVFRLLVAIMCYWVRHAQPPVTALHVYSLALSVIKLSLLTHSPTTDGRGAAGRQDASTGKHEQDVSEVSGVKKGPHESEDLKPFSQRDSTESVPKAEEQTGESNDILSDLKNSTVVELPLEPNKLGKIVGVPADDQPICKDQSPNVWLQASSVHQELRHFCDERDYKFASNNLEKFSTESKNYERSQFKATVIHGFAQFQTCLQAAMYLNMLLRCPMSCLSPPCIYNGTFLYNLTVELQRWVDPKSYIFGQLGRKSPLCELWTKIVDVVISAVPENRFAKIKEGFKLGKNDKRKKVTTHNQTERSKNIENESTSDDSDHESIIVNAKCSLENRFSGLFVDDS